MAAGLVIVSRLARRRSSAAACPPSSPSMAALGHGGLPRRLGDGRRVSVANAMRDGGKWEGTLDAVKRPSPRQRRAAPPSKSHPEGRRRREEGGQQPVWREREVGADEEGEGGW